MTPEKALRELMAGDGPVTVIVGAGISVNATGRKDLTWRGLLDHGISFCEGHRRGDPDAMRARLSHADNRDAAVLLEIADDLTAALEEEPEDLFGTWLRAALGGLVPEHPEALEALINWDVPIATTNYDDLLYRTLLNETGLKPDAANRPTWRAPDAISGALWGTGGEERNRAVIFLHGYYDDPDSVIFGKRSYDRLLADLEFREYVRGMAISSTLVFIGFGSGIADPTILSLRTWMRDVLKRSGRTHYRLVEANERADADDEHGLFDRIQPVSYASHDALGTLLLYLKKPSLQRSLDALARQYAARIRLAALPGDHRPDAGNHALLLGRHSTVRRVLADALRAADVTVRHLTGRTAEAALESMALPEGSAILVYLSGTARTMQNGDVVIAADDRATIPLRRVAEALAEHPGHALLVVDAVVEDQLLLEFAVRIREIAEAADFASGLVGMVAVPRQASPDLSLADALAGLIAGGPASDGYAWHERHAVIPSRKLATELQAMGFAVVEIEARDGAGVIPNPQFKADVEPQRVIAALRERTAGAEVHFFGKAEDFVGRKSLRKEIRAWLAKDDPPVLIVTGLPGTGKSALMGQLLRESEGDPAARAVGPAAPDALVGSGPFIDVGTFAVGVHAKQKPWATIEAELLRAPRRSTVLLDALDEAEASADVAGKLARLVEQRKLRIVIGTRPGVAKHVRAVKVMTGLLASFPQADVRWIENDKEGRADIAKYARNLLGASGSKYRDIRESTFTSLIRAVGVQAAGNFLMAHVLTHWLLELDKPITKDRGWRNRMRLGTGESGLGNTLRKDLDTHFPRTDEREMAEDLLRAVAWSEGLGLPATDLWTQLATRLSIRRDRDYTAADIGWLLRNAGWYLMEDSDGPRPAYRLFHQLVIDWFRSQSPRGAAACQHEIVRVLIENAERSKAWSGADNYVRQHVITHAQNEPPTDTDADDLLADPGFLAWADADRLIPVVRARRRSLRPSIGPLIQRAVHGFSDASPAERLALLMLTAKQERLPQPQLPSIAGSPWKPLWATWQASAAHVALSGHGGPVLGVAGAIDADRLASADAAGTISVWESTTGDLLQPLSGHDGPVLSIAIEPGGERILSGGDDFTVRLWEVDTGAHEILAEHNGPVTCVTWSRDGQRIASGSRDSTVRVWDISRDEPVRGRPAVHTVEHRPTPVAAMALTPDGQRLAVARLDRSVRIRDAGSPNGAQIVIDDHDTFVTALDFSPDARRLASGSSSGIVLLSDAISGEPMLAGDAEQAIECLAFSPDGASVAIGGRKDMIAVWGLTPDAPSFGLAGHHDTVTSIAFSTDGQELLSGSADATMRIWQLLRRDVPTPIKSLPGEVEACAVTHDGKHVVTAGSTRVQAWNISTGEPARERGKTITFERGRRWWLAPDERPLAVACSRYGFVAASWARGSIELWESPAEHPRHLVREGTRTYALCFSPDGLRLATGSQDNFVRIWDVTGEQSPPAVLEANTDVWSLAFAPCGSRLAAACADGKVRIFSDDGPDPLEISAGDVDVLSVSFDPSGGRLAIGGEDRAIRLWSEGAGVTELGHHRAAVHAVAFSPDGEMLASGSEDGSVRLWTHATRKQIGVISVRSGVRDLVWRGSRLVIAAVGGIAAVTVA